MFQRMHYEKLIETSQSFSRPAITKSANIGDIFEPIVLFVNLIIKSIKHIIE